MQADHVATEPMAKRIRRTKADIDFELAQKGIYSDPDANGAQRYRCKHCHTPFAPSSRAHATRHECPATLGVAQHTGCDVGAVPLGASPQDGPAAQHAGDVSGSPDAYTYSIPACTEDWAVRTEADAPAYYTTEEADLIAMARATALDAAYEELIGYDDWRARGGLEDLDEEEGDDIAPRPAGDRGPLPMQELADAAADQGVYAPRPIGVHLAPAQRRLQEVHAAQQGRRPPKKGTGAWLCEHRGDPITPGHAVTVVQACYWLATMKNDHRVTDTVIDQYCAMMHHLILPPDNLYPASYHMVKAVLDVESSTTCTKHICDKCWTVFPTMDPAAYPGNADAVCAAEGCGNRRFDVSETGGVFPKRNIYYFDVRATVLDLLDPVLEDLDAYREQRKQAFQDPASFLSSPAGQHVDAALGHKLSKPSVAENEIVIPFSVGGDGVQIYTNKVYGTLACGLKLTDAPEGLQAKNITWSPVCIVQGPTEPGSYHDVMAPIIEFFEKHDPGRPGSTPLLVDVGGPQLLKVWPVLVCAQGDIPFMTKLTGGLHHTGPNACFACAMSGAHNHEANTVRWLGFDAGLFQRVPCYAAAGHCAPMAGQTLHPHEMAAVDNSGDHPRVPLGYLQKDDGRFLARTAYTDPMDVATTTWMTDNVLKLSGLEIKMRGRKAKLYKDQVLHPTLAAVAKKDQTQREEWANQMQKELGARGEPMFQSLSYVNPCHFFRYGIAHIFLLGILKDFWRMWLRQVSSGGHVLPTYIRQHISKKGAEILVTELFGKPYTDLIRYRGLWMMEEWLAFTETFSLFLLHDLPWKRQDLELKKAFDEQWTLLRSSVLYFMKWHDGQHTEERILQAQKDLLEYGRIVEKAYGGRFLTTYKLHLAAMHLADQVRACGPGYTWSEFWVERMVQLVKRMVKYRSTAYPELLFVHDWLLTLACRRVLLTPDGCHCVSLSEALRAVKRRRQCSRDVPLPDQALLLGAPKKVDAGEKGEVLWCPSPDAAGDDQVMKGLPLLLFEDTTLLQDGWPVFKDADAAEREALILHELGLQGPLGAGKDGVEVELQKFTRADLPIGETMSSVQCKTQTRKNNQWFMIRYCVAYADGRTEMKVYVGQFLYFVRATFKSSMLPEGAHRPGCARQHPADLRLGVANLYTSVDQHGPGVRPADPGICRLHEFVKVDNLDPSKPGTRFEGVFVLDLRSIDSQAVPTRERNDTRFFCVSAKLSSRYAGVKR